MSRVPLQVVVADANVLINLLLVARLHLVAELPDLKLAVPDHVLEEITSPEQRAGLDLAVASGRLQVASIREPEDIGLFVELTVRLGRGEAACLVLAIRNGWMVASDEKRRFRREALSRIGDDRLIGTADLFIRAIHAGLLTVEDADADKEVLGRHRFRLPFRSFREVVRVSPSTKPAGGR